MVNVAAALIVLVGLQTSSLVRDLGVVSKNNEVANTAAGLLVAKGDSAVSELTTALTDPNERVRYYAIRCLGEINTKSARAVLIKASITGEPSIRRHASYTLTWNPADDAASVYLYALTQDYAAHHRVSTIKALSQIKCEKALPPLKLLTEDRAWAVSYAAHSASRHIAGKSPDIEQAVETLRRGKFDSTVDPSAYRKAASLLLSHPELSGRDLLDVCFYRTKAQPTELEPTAEFLIGKMSKQVIPLLQLALEEKEDAFIKFEAARIVNKYGWQESLKGLGG